MTMKKVCPQCGEKGTLRKILYGYLMGPPDETKYISGGCTILPGQDFDIGCCQCSWQGFSTKAKREEFKKLNKRMAKREDKEKAAKTD